MVEPANEKEGEQEPVRVVTGELELTFHYAYGKHYDRFYREMRDNMKITGIRCLKCGSVLLPPRPYCGYCFEPADEWVEVADEGEVLTFTEVHLPFPGQPTEPPYIYAFIMLDGADVQFPHLIGDADPSQIEVGMRVKAVWSKDRKGTLHDIKYFRPVNWSTAGRCGESRIDSRVQDSNRDSAG